MFYSQVILAKKGPLAKVWLAAHWGDKKLGRPQIFATDISQSVESIVNPSVPLALRVSGHLLLGVVRIYSRKVKYVLNDCTEAMLKLQMAFLPRKDLLEQTDGKENKAATTVANFGEYDQVHVVEGFALPLPDQNEWILAEDDEEDGEIMTQLANTQQQQQQQQHSSSPQGNYQPPQEETWVPFDPENEDEDIQTDPLNQSLVSEVELVRAADESFLSGDQTRRESSILPDNKSDLLQGPRDPEEEEPTDFGAIPFDNDSEDEQEHPLQQEQQQPQDDSLLQLSTRTSDAHDISGISGLTLEEGEEESKKRPLTTPKRRRRKRRKVVIDNDETELSTEHIKNMITNTDDIVQRQIHPAELHAEPAAPNRIVLTQPFLADDGHLHPALQRLWQNNFWRALEEPCSYEREEPTDDVEHVRRDGTLSDLEDDEEEELSTTRMAKQDEGQEEEPTDFGNDFQMDEEEDQVEPPEMDEEDGDVLREQQDPAELELEDLGLVNELELDSEDDDDEDRQAIGDQSSNSTKWHKHTVKVLQLLQRKIKEPREENDNNDDEEEEKPAEVQFQDLSHNCTRRTAASVFFELLQLKTWDFVELDQPEPYGDIGISAGVRFSEQPPNH